MNDYPGLPIVGDTVRWRDYSGHGECRSLYSGKVVKCDDDGVLVSVLAYGDEPCFQHISYTKIVDVCPQKVTP